MIGDLLFYMDGDTLVPVVVRKINGEDNVVCLRQSDGHKFNTMIDFLRPIPLTPEILEKNGFSSNFAEDNLSYAESCGDVIGIHIMGKNGCMDEMYFDYVHQVQHALILCRIDEKITLP